MKLRRYLDDRRVRIGGAVAVLFLIGIIGSSLSLLGQSMDHSPDPRTSDYAGVQETSLDLARSGGAGDAVEANEKKKATRISLDLKVDSVQESQNQVISMVENYNGEVESTYFNRRHSASGRVSARIPSNRTSEFLSEIESKYHVDSRDRDTTDITDRYTETELELKNKRQELRKLEEMMNRTDKVDSLIKIQKRMSELRSRIQYLERSMEDLNERTDYTRVDIELDQKESFTSEFEVRKTVTDSYRGIFESLRFIIVGIGYLIPFGLLYLLWKGGRKLKSRLEDEA